MEPSVTWREYTDLKVQHEREMREAKEVATALALALQAAQSEARMRTIVALGAIGVAALAFLYQR